MRVEHADKAHKEHELNAATFKSYDPVFIPQISSESKLGLCSNVIYLAQ